MLKVLSNILCDSKVKVIGQKAGICNCVPSTSALVCILLYHITLITYSLSATSRTVTVLKGVELVTSPSMSTIVMN